MFNCCSKIVISKRFFNFKEIPVPRVLKEKLDEYIIGQSTPKKILSVAIYNHYLRIKDRKDKKQKLFQYELLKTRIQQEETKVEIAKERARSDFSSESETLADNTAEFTMGLQNMQNRIKTLESELKGEDFNLQLSKSNILMVGPSGSGKTLLTTTLANFLNVPIAITDCTQLTQAGYTGEDVQITVERLLINGDYKKDTTEMGIIVLDEVDKLSKKGGKDGNKDVSGEGVQQSLLKILEGHEVEMTIKRPIDPDHAERQLRKTGVHSPMVKEEKFVIDTSNILFILSGAFVGLDKIIYQRLNPLMTSEEINKLDTCEFVIGKDGVTKTSTMSLVQPMDLVTFGLIPELIGRVPIITSLNPLNEKDLFHILYEPKNSFIKQYEYIFSQFGITLRFTEKALKQISKWAMLNKTGARGLKSILENTLLDCNFECPKTGVSYILITESNVNHLINQSGVTVSGASFSEPIHYYSRGEQDKYIENAYKEDMKLGKELDTLFGRACNNTQ
ncbi:hypothetical protein QEN19_000244 [Hanseniaspora menglaensis]